MLKGLLKIFLGDKSSSDLKEIQPIVDDILLAEKSLINLSADELRAKSTDLRTRINDHIADLQGEIDELKIKAETMPESDLDAKEAVFERIDKLELEINEELEVVLAKILPEAFALVKETAKRFTSEGEIEVTALQFDKDIAARRDMVRVEGEKAFWSNTWKAAGSDVTWEMVHYDVQLVGGVSLHRGSVAEMHTGEGKTLVATLPVFLNALTGRGVHLVTVNDYLAKRDSEWMGPLYEFHGLTVDCIDKHQPNSESRREAYKCDITFGTNNEFGFDYLRDNMAKNPNMLVQRRHHYAIVDEVDSVLIDEARTPLIISGPTPKGDEQEFESLKPMVVKLIQVQQKAVQGFLLEAKKLLTDGLSKEENEAAGLALYRAFRGLPKSKPIIKFLSNEGMRQRLLKVESFYLADNQREMHKADEELFFVIDEKQNQIELSEKGILYLTQGMDDDAFFTMPDIATELVAVDNLDANDDEKLSKKQEVMQDYGVKSARIHSMNQLLKAYTLFEKDIEYVIMDNKVKIVDEQTGRIMDGRRYSDGLHQAIEAKENVKIEAATQTYATVTLQNFFRMYHKLAGMTGTAETEAGEFWDIYKLDVKVIPTNRPIARDDREDLVYKTKREKYNAAIEQIAELSKSGRPVLVGTTTVEVSELLSRMLDMRGLDHQVLNAKRHQQEAEVVTRAGQAGTITIATNMAGRGTDIKLTKEVKEAGGLAIIGTERHDSRRVDRQLRGRAGRQGDPGSSQFYASLEDDLMRLFGSDRVAKMMDRMGHKDGEVIQHKMISKSIERAQTKVEENNFGIRKRLLEYDDVMNAQREVIYKLRRNALYGDRIRTDIANMFFELVEANVDATHESKDYDNFRLAMLSNLGIEAPVSENDFLSADTDDLVYLCYSQSEQHYRSKIEDLSRRAHPVIQRVYDDESNDFKSILVPFSDGLKTIQVSADIDESVATEAVSVMKALEQQVVLAVIDLHWKEHLRSMDDLRNNVQHARHEQKDPLLIYKFESYELFKQMVQKVNAEVASFLMKCTIPINAGEQPLRQGKKVEVAPLGKTSKAGVDNIAQQNAARAAGGGGAISPSQPGQHHPTSRPKPVDPIRTEKKVQPNSPCPCGSGKKFKKCHGK
ncbi:MAG: preprotein translocase subunit SecA [Flavobacteriales bacterium]|jgi:preprotein translocase subunit SecA|nr:preprotein translocase subunit SecA [Flavobacteriales bacterium]